MKKLEGKKFGKLTVLRRSPNRAKSRHIQWECLCECGNITTVSSQHLQDGGTSSCGCARKGVNAISLTGQRFGRLVAIKPTPERTGNSIVWECQCDCGNSCQAAATHLRKGETRSCGCLASEHGIKAIQVAKAVRDTYFTDNTDLMSIASDQLIKTNTSGYTGISLDRSVGLWKATIVFKGRKYYLGSAHTPEELVDVRTEAKKRIHGDFLEWYRQEYPERYDKLFNKKPKEV